MAGSAQDLAALGQGSLDVGNCRAFRSALNSTESPLVSTIRVWRSFRCDDESWGVEELVVRKSVLITGAQAVDGGPSPVIQWTAAPKLFVVAPPAQVTFQNLIFVQPAVPADKFDIAFLKTLTLGETSFLGVVLGVKDCPGPISTYVSYLSRQPRPPSMPGTQTFSEQGRNSLLLEDVAIDFESGGNCRLCFSALQCDVGAEDALLQDLLADQNTKSVCVEPGTPVARSQSPVPAEGSGGTNVLVIISVSVFGAMLALCVITTIVIVWFRRQMAPPAYVGEVAGKGAVTRGVSVEGAMYTGGSGKGMIGADAQFGSNHWNLQLSDVQLGAPLGKGGFGRVYKGSWQGTTVAVKIICHNDKTLQTNVGEPFEAFLSKHISHPNVVQTFHISTREMSSVQQQGDQDVFFDTNGHAVEEGLGSHRGHAQNPSEELFGSFNASQSLDVTTGSRFETWIVLEYCDRGSLEKAISDGSFLLRGPAKAYRIGHVLKTGLEIAHAMHYLHSVRIIHGDLKPGNILLKGDNSDSRGFTCKVGDFGLSRFMAEETHIQTFTCGTVTHMPPELLKGGMLTPAVDVYSFGILMWELMSGHRPYPGKSQREIMLAVIDGCRPAITEDFFPEYVDMLNMCWDQDYSKRPSFPMLIDTLMKMLDKHGRRRAPSNLVGEDDGPPPLPSPIPIDVASGAASREDAMSAFKGDNTPLAHGIKRQLTPSRLRARAAEAAAEREDFVPNGLLDSFGSDVGNRRLYSSVGVGGQFVAEGTPRQSGGSIRGHAPRTRLSVGQEDAQAQSSRKGSSRGSVQGST
eukprot:evm.model.scf_682EXC.10 EVM.evm.TU.scf_682EXC.10   scf_682EXC:53115-55517(-)